jgi:hypothetical protein
MSGILATPILPPPGMVYVFMPTFGLIVTAPADRLGIPEGDV